MENKELLEKVIKDRLEASLSDELDQEEKRAVFREAMEAIDRQLEIERSESAKEERMPNRIMRGVEIVAIPVVLTGVELLAKWKFMKTVCNFEKDYTFTTTPGRSISSLFRWK